MNRYDDIINLPRHISQRHPQMSMHDRAAQFSPFAALVGYENAVTETARLTDGRCELSPDVQVELNRRLVYLAKNLAEKPSITIKYFVADDRKDGGAYVTAIGIVEKFSNNERMIIMQDGTEISIDDIMEIDSNLFVNLE